VILKEKSSEIEMHFDKVDPVEFAIVGVESTDGLFATAVDGLNVDSLEMNLTATSFKFTPLSRMCEANPCLNDGTCFDSYRNLGFYCTCKFGYSGKFCEKSFECNSGNCVFGTCITTKTCQCFSGYSGDNCAVATDYHQDKSHKSSKLNLGVIIGPIVGFFVSLFIVIWFVRKRNQSKCAAAKKGQQESIDPPAYQLNEPPLPICNPPEYSMSERAPSSQSSFRHQLPPINQPFTSTPLSQQNDMDPLLYSSNFEPRPIHL